MHTFDGGCSNKSCIAECQNRATLYSSKQQEDAYLGNGFGPIRRFLTCAKVSEQDNGVRIVVLILMCSKVTYNEVK